MKNGFFCFLLAIAGIVNEPLSAQDISGVWVGNYSKNLLSVQPQKLVVELFVHEDSLITGASHLYYKNNSYEHYTLVGRYNKMKSSVNFREDSTLGVNLGFMAGNCLGNYTTKLVVTDSSMQLTGTWEDNADGLFHCPTTKVFLEKLLPKKKAAPVAQAPTPASAPVAVVEKPKEKDRNLERASEIQSLIEIPIGVKDSIRVELYDNKEIDGDIISLYVNDNIVLSKQTLAAKPLVLYLSLNPGEPVCKIKMAAESMGAEPPCTAMMVITTTKGKKYQVNLSSTYGKNSIVELFLKE